MVFERVKLDSASPMKQILIWLVRLCMKDTALLYNLRISRIFLNSLLLSHSQPLFPCGNKDTEIGCKSAEKIPWIGPAVT